MNATLAPSPAFPRALIGMQSPLSESRAAETRAVSEGEPSDARQFTAEIASLSTARIMEMTAGELADVIRKVRMAHLNPGVLEQLARMDGTTLRRLVFATRRYCRDQALLSEGVFQHSASTMHIPR